MPTKHPLTGKGRFGGGREEGDVLPEHKVLWASAAAADIRRRPRQGLSIPGSRANKINLPPRSCATLMAASAAALETYTTSRYIPYTRLSLSAPSPRLIGDKNKSYLEIEKKFGEGILRHNGGIIIL